MKRCRISGTVYVVLILASLFVLSGCGIPNYLNLDDEITINSNAIVDGIQVDLTIAEAGINKIFEYDVQEGPSLKFFYTLSTNSSHTALISNQDSDYPSNVAISSISTYFKNNYKGTTGNGISWSPESPIGALNPSAPAFFLYTKSDNSTNNFARKSESITNLADDEVGIIIETFSFHPLTISDNPTNYYFGDVPQMDVKLPVTELSTMADPKTYSFELHKVQSGVTGRYAIEFNDSHSDLLYFASYKRNLFPQDNTTEELEDYLLEDTYFHLPVYRDLVNSTTSLYLHLWVAVYAGEGDFTNIYWSPLKYLGSINLF